MPIKVQNLNTIDYEHHSLGGGTDPADPATARPMFALWCLKG